MKFFYFCDFITWGGMHKHIDDNLVETYEVKGSSSRNEIKLESCDNMICLWNEDNIDKREEDLICGEISIHDQSAKEQREYLYKIGDAIANEKVVVFAIRDDAESRQLLEYLVELKRKRGFLLHIFMNLDIPTYGQNERCLLPKVNCLQSIDSISFFNYADVDDMEKYYDLRFSEYKKQISLCEEILQEEAGKRVGLLAELTSTNSEEVWLFLAETNGFEKICIQENDLRQPDDGGEFVLEVIAARPNEGKQMCERLKEYRKEFKFKYNLKQREQRCTFKGMCKGSCARCEEYACKLWTEVHGAPKKGLDGECARISRIDRLREEVDGPGIRTLVILNECELNCKYCINREYVNRPTMGKRMWISWLSEILQKDAVYFEITGGGVTFGGGEPLLKAAFIKEYKECNPSISVAVETSLNVDYDAVKSLADIVDYWIVDIKDMNDEIYFSYTGQSNARMIQNLVYLLKRNTQIRCRVPKIPEYNTDDDVQNSVAQLREMGVQEIEVFEYEVR